MGSRTSLERAPAYSPAARLLEVRALLESSGGITLAELATRFEVSKKTALRYLRALERAGDPVCEEPRGRSKVWRFESAGRRESIPLTASQMISLFLSRRVFDFLRGTGFKEDLDDVFARLERTLQRRTFARVQHLDRKLWDMNEAHHRYEERSEDVGELLEALLRSERLRVTHGSVDDWRQPFDIDPYTLVVYKKGLYLAGFSHHPPHRHRPLRTFALDGFRDVERLHGQTFDYPADYHPSQLDDGAFGMQGEPRRPIRVRFTRKVGRFVYRRQWHPTQEVVRAGDGYELRMEVCGMRELQSWLLGFGDQVEVLEPPELREAIRAEHERAAARNAPLGA